jgi:hypothetical protein
MGLGLLLKTATTRCRREQQKMCALSRHYATLQTSLSDTAQGGRDILRFLDFSQLEGWRHLGISNKNHVEALLISAPALLLDFLLEPETIRNRYPNQKRNERAKGNVVANSTIVKVEYGT